MADVGMWTGINQGVQNLTSTGMRLMEFRANREQQARLEAQAQSQLAETIRQHGETTGIQRQQLVETQRQRAVSEQAQALAQKKFYAENPDQQPWDMTKFMQLDSTFRLKGMPVDDLPFWQDLKAMAADNKIYRGDVANTVAAKWPEWKAQSSESLSTKVSQLSDKAAALPENDPKRKEIMGQIDKNMNAMKLIESIPDDKAKQMLFPDIWQKEQKAAKPVTLDQVKAAIALNPKLAESLTPEQKSILGITPKDPNIKSVDRGDVVDIYENGVKVRTEKKGVSPGTAPKPEKAPTSIDNARLLKMVTDATADGKEPTANEVEIIKTEAAKSGYDFKKLTGKSAAYGLPGIDRPLWGGNETSAWQLVPKGNTTKTTANPPPGFVDSGRTSGGKKVYVKGDQAWIAP